VVAAAAAITVFVALGKVFSPQFLLWLVPIVPLVRGRRGVAASAVLLLALGLTQSYFPRRYDALAMSYVSPESWLLLARNLIVCALAIVLAAASRSSRGVNGGLPGRLPRRRPETSHVSVFLSRPDEERSRPSPQPE
jgi:hypothetical protein